MFTNKASAVVADVRNEKSPRRMRRGTASTVEAELLALRDKEGLIKPPVVHDWAAAHPESAIHARLTWDDARAGYQQRLWQIRQLIQLEIRYENKKPKMISLSIDRRRRGGGYRLIKQVVKKPDLMRVALRDALTELQLVKAKYEHLRQLRPVWNAIDEAERTVKVS